MLLILKLLSVTENAGRSIFRSRSQYRVCVRLAIVVAQLNHCSTDVTSLTSSIRNHVYENGRRYHSLNAGTYALPNDEVSSPGEWYRLNAKTVRNRPNRNGKALFASSVRSCRIYTDPMPQQVGYNAPRSWYDVRRQPPGSAAAQEAQQGPRHWDWNRDLGNFHGRVKTLCFAAAGRTVKLTYCSQHPEAIVIGVDLSPIQPSWCVPSGLFLWAIF